MYSIVKRDDIMRDLTRLASRIVMFFMQFYYRLARHSRVSYKAYIDGRTRLAGYNTIQDNVLLAGQPVSAGALIFAEGVISPMQRSVRFVRSVGMSVSSTTASDPHIRIYSPWLFSLPTGNRGFRLSGKNGMRTAGISIGNDG